MSRPFDAGSTVAVVGTGLAGCRAAETLRRDGFRGRLVLVGDEDHPPYDRPPLSKQFLAGTWGEERLALLRPEKLAGLEAQWHTGVPVAGLDLAGRRLDLADGGRIDFDGLVLATGARPRHLPGVPPGPGVTVLRTLDDARALRHRLVAGATVVVVGGGFIGAEVAATAQRLGCTVTILEALDVPLARVLGSGPGEVVRQLHEAHGVTVRTTSIVAGITQDVTGALDAVELADGIRLPADVVVVGIGVTPATGWLEGSGLTLADGVLVDAALRAADGVVAAGDLARRDDGSGTPLRIEHWTNAAEQGAHAARSLLAGAAAVPLHTVPYVWSDQYDTKIQIIGLPQPDDEVVLVDGSFESGRFVACYARRGQLAAVVGFGRPRQLMAYRRFLETPTDLADVLAAPTS